MALAARCPDCSTAFRIVADQLKISEGWVRCGHCGHVFDALTAQYDVPEAVLEQTLREQKIPDAPSAPKPYAASDRNNPDEIPFHDSLLSEFHIGWADTIIPEAPQNQSEDDEQPFTKAPWGSHLVLDDIRLEDEDTPQEQASSLPSEFDVEQEDTSSTPKFTPWWAKIEDEESFDEGIGTLKRRLFPLPSDPPPLEEEQTNKTLPQVDVPTPGSVENEADAQQSDDFAPVDVSSADVITVTDTDFMFVDTQNSVQANSEVISVSDTDFMHVEPGLETAFLLDEPEEKPATSPFGKHAPTPLKPHTSFDSVFLNDDEPGLETAFLLDEPEDKPLRSTSSAPKANNPFAIPETSRTRPEDSAASLPPRASSIATTNTGAGMGMDARKETVPTAPREKTPSEKKHASSQHQSRLPTASRYAEPETSAFGGDSRLQPSNTLAPASRHHENEALDDFSFVRTSASNSFWHRPLITTLCTLLFCVFSVTLLLQISLTYKDSIAAQLPALRPALSALCKPFGCTVNYPRNIQGITIDDITFSSSSSSSSNHYTLDLLLRNRSPELIALPWVELALHNSQGQTIISRALSPKDLGITQAALRPGEELIIKRDFSVNADDVRGFNAIIFYP